MIKFIGTYLLVCLSPFLTAQFNDSTRFYFGYSCTGNYNKTRDRVGYLINNNMDFKQKSKYSSFSLNLKQLFGKQQQALVNDDVSIIMNLNVPFGVPRLYSWGHMSYAHIFSLKVNTQFQSGAGLAFYLYDRKRFKCSISDGILYDFSDLKKSDSINETYTTLRNSFRLQVRGYMKKTLTFQSAFYVQNSIQHKGDIILKNETEILLHLIGIVNGSIRLLYNKMTRTDSETFLVTWGFSLNKYF